MLHPGDSREAGFDKWGYITTSSSEYSNVFSMNMTLGDSGEIV